MAEVHRVIIVSNFYPPYSIGGAEVVAHRQAQALQDRGHEVVVLAGRLPTPDAEAGSVDVETYDGILVYRLTLRSLDLGDGARWIAASRILQNLILVHDADIVHFHNIIGFGAQLIDVARSAGVATVLTLHDHWGFCHRNTRLRKNGSVCTDATACSVCDAEVPLTGGFSLPMRMRQDWIRHRVSKVDTLISPSAYLAAAYREAAYPGREISHISNGVNLSQVGPRPKPGIGVLKFACLSYLGEHKGISQLISAAEILARDPRLAGRWTLTVAGAGHLEATVQQAAESDLLRGHLIWAGKLEHAAAVELMQASHAIILASLWPENEPVTLLEAIASGTAQIATAIGGTPELVRDEETGLLVAPGDASALATAMKTYIENPALCLRHGAFNAQRRRDYDSAHTIDRILRVYRTVGDPRPAPSPRGSRIIICVGASTPDDLNMMLHVHQFYLAGSAEWRFIWYGWATPEDWREAALVWIFDGTSDAMAVARALNQGKPVIAPAGGQGLLGSSPAPIFEFNTYLEAAALLQTLLSQTEADLQSLCTGGRDIALLMYGILPRHDFDSRSEAPL